MASPVVNEIIRCLDEKKSFLLDAGAGSGKTWTLIETLKHIISKRSEYLSSSTQMIACITYTNVAKNEIIERIEYNSFVLVSTIHEFLWSCIQSYQKELHTALIKHVQTKLEKYERDFNPEKAETTKKHSALRDTIDKTRNAIEALQSSFVPIEYKPYPKYKKGYISHDDIIDLSEMMFAEYPKLRRLIAGKYPIILVDEYQDTQPETVKILLDYIHQTGWSVIGFFGDKMQKIYDDGVGDISHREELTIIQKLENYRCPKSVIRLLNKIRPELQQVPGKDNQIEGSCKFYYGSSKMDVNSFISKYIDPESSLDYKRLYLTHKTIASENGYGELYEVYKGKADALIRNSDHPGLCPWADFLFALCKLLDLYHLKQYQDLLQVTSFDVNAAGRRAQLRSLLDKLSGMEDDTIGVVKDFVLENKILAKTDGMTLFDFDTAENKDRYDALMKLPFRMFKRLHEVVEGHTPFSTKHGTKGTEFPNVLVIIDDDAWNQYSFVDYFANKRDNMNRFLRTMNLFYVVCSRATENLVVLCQTPLDNTVLNNVKAWFDNCIEITGE